jgi:hypothetical protein
MAATQAAIRTDLILVAAIRTDLILVAATRTEAILTAAPILNQHLAETSIHTTTVVPLDQVHQASRTTPIPMAATLPEHHSFHKNGLSQKRAFAEW